MSFVYKSINDDLNVTLSIIPEKKNDEREWKSSREGKKERNGKYVAIAKSACTKRACKRELLRMLGQDRREGWTQCNETARSAAGIILITKLTAVGRFLSANSLPDEFETRAGRLGNNRTHERTNERPGFSAKRENATAFLISYCVLTCHTCDHAMQYRGLEFLFSAPGPFNTPLPPSHEGPGRVGVGSCAFQIMRSRVHQPRLRYEHYARSRYR